VRCARYDPQLLHCSHHRRTAHAPHLSC
jgi:hypothetical protein